MGSALASMREDLREQSRYLQLQWEAVARVEVRGLLWLQAHRDTFPPLRLLKMLLSWHPMKDITVLIWLSFIASLPWLGYPLCFEFMSIAIITFAVNWIAGARLPYQLSSRVKCLSHISPYGCPNMEVTMAAVIATAMARAYGEAWAWTAGYSAVLFFAFTRLYAGTSFFHQVAFSWAWGAVGMVLFRDLTAHFFPKRVPDHWKLAASVIMFAQILGWVAYRAERNASPFLRINKSEYTRVLTHIMNQDEGDEVEEEDDEDLLQAASVSSMGSGVSDGDAQYRRARRRRNKVDSFGYLVRAMERKAAAGSRAGDDEGSIMG